jgi:putative DNA primase/helicase
VSAREDAFALAAQGFRIIPLAPGSKAANLPEWPQRATTDLAELGSMFPAPDDDPMLNVAQNLAVVTGDGLLVLDVDPKNGGDGSLLDLQFDQGVLPTTRTVRTPSGGRHFYYRVPPDRHVPNSTSKLGPGLDIRGDGGYVAAPPSKTEKGEYVWENTDTPVADAPAWLIEKATEPRTAKAASESASNEIPQHRLTIADAREMLGHLDPNTDYNEWAENLWSIRRIARGAQDGSQPPDWFALGDKWSRGDLKNPPAPVASYQGFDAVKAKMLEADKRPGYGAKHLIEAAKVSGWKPTAEQEVRMTRQNVAPTDEFEVVPTAPNVTGAAGDPLNVEDRPPAERPVIRITASNGDEVLRTAIDVLRREVYVTGNQLVRVVSAIERETTPVLDDKGRVIGKDGIRRDIEQASMIPATTHWMWPWLTGNADVIVPAKKAGEWKRINFPERFANTILGQGHHDGLRVANAIARAPFVREDGSVCDAPGYDEASRTIYRPNARFPKLPETASREDALEAIRVLLLPFAEFPFLNDSCRSAFLAHILTEAARPALPAAPLFFYSAPDASTGKTLLSWMPSTIVHGVLPASRPWVDSDEIRKTLFSSLLAGDRSILFDNMPTGYKVRSSELCAFLTAPTWQDRKLGKSETPTIANKSVVSISGNNISPAGDMPRRSLMVRTVANMTKTQLRQRTFKIPNLRAYVQLHRVELLMAALTIIRAYKQQSGFEEPVPLPSFEEWSALVRCPLLWLGQADPVDSQRTQEDGDEEEGGVEAAFALLAPVFAGRDFLAADILARIRADVDGASGVSAIAAAISSAGCSNVNDTKTLGYWLRECRDKVAGGHQLYLSGDTGTHAKKYRFRPMRDNLDLA